MHAVVQIKKAFGAVKSPRVLPFVACIIGGIGGVLILGVSPSGIGHSVALGLTGALFTFMAREPSCAIGARTWIVRTARGAGIFMFISGALVGLAIWRAAFQLVPIAAMLMMASGVVGGILVLAAAATGRLPS